jgi:hypothetical protein
MFKDCCHCGITLEDRDLSYNDLCPSCFFNYCEELDNLKTTKVDKVKDNIISNTNFNTYVQKRLRVELNKWFEIEGQYSKYKLEKRGDQTFLLDEFDRVNFYTLCFVLNNPEKVIVAPKFGEVLYISDVSTPKLYSEYIWQCTTHDELIWKQKKLYKTEELAIEASREFLGLEV